MDNALHRLWQLLFVLLMCALCLPATGQPGAPQRRLPGDQRLLELEFLPNEVQPALELPPVRPPELDAPLSEGPTFVLRGVRFSGNTVVTNDELQAVVAPYLERPVSTTRLEALRRALTLVYVERGFVNSGATLPNQDVEGGVVRFEIVEGHLSEIALEGNERLRDAYIVERLKTAAGVALNVNDLGERIQLLLEDPLIDRINATLEPGASPGESRLDVSVREASRFDLRFTFDNHRAPSVGELQGGVHARFQNYSGFGESLTLSHWRTEGLDDTVFRLELPLTRYDTRAFVRAQITNSEVVTRPFNEIDVESESVDYDIGLRQPLFRGPGKELSAALSLSVKQSTTFLLGRRADFAPGVRNGRSNVTVLRGTLDWTSRGRDQVFTVRSVLSGGVDAFGATRNPGSEPDGRFFAWLGQAQWARRLNDNGLQIIARADAQLTPDRLLPLEKFGVGGASTVRGYLENQLVRDNGWVVSLEGRIPLIRLPVPGLSKSADDGVVSLAPFVDFGHSWNRDAPSPGEDSLSSVGAGLRWRVSERAQANIYFAWALDDQPSEPEGSLQDNGLHFQLMFNPF